MGIPIRELQQRVSSAEFTEYWAAYTLDPWGEERADWRAAQQAALTVAVAGVKNVKMADYFPQYDPEQPSAGRSSIRQTAEEQIAIMAMLTVMSGGEDLRGQQQA